MDQIKRKLSFNQSSEEKTKKVQHKFNRSITSIENFSNEFFYEIFDYLDGCDLYQAFSNLNSRFQQMLNSSSLLFKIKFDLIYNGTMNKYNQFILLNKHQIFSINIWLPLKYNDFFSSFIFDSSLNRLESIVIRGIESDILISLLINLACLHRLFSLNIGVSNTVENLNEIYRLIFALPSLKYNNFNICGSNHLISLPIATTNKQFSTIEHLVIDHSCTLNELASVVSYTPQLRHLHLFDTKKNDPSIRTILPMTLENLTYIYMFLHCITFDELQIFITKLSSKLKILSITQSHDITFLNAYRWEQLILQYFPELEKFYLKYFDNVDDEYQYPIYSEGQNQFSSLFWIERQWIFTVEMTGENIRYSVHPYRKRWYEDTEDKIVNSSVKLSKSTGLTISYIDPIDYDEAIPIDIKRVLTIAQIYHLEISEENVFIGILVEIMNLLCELDSLKIHSLSLDQLENLSAEEVEICSLAKGTNKITKVYLKKMIDIQEIYFLMKFCPHMKYLKINSINNMDIELFVRQILNKINFEHNQYLRLLCFRVPMADDEIIKQLEKMMNAEKLLVDYSIKRVCDIIYLQWQ